ncbi:MAG TPA: 2-keto-4-pentenoate hydratase, partial [Magnetospirillaceae bacterium]|nr:2-keto-4-pentenoate hydratase [Magnetospirillaceae bacterium]
MSISANGTGTIQDIALAFVAARRLARPLPAYPGIPPRDMATAYAVQEEAIARWPDTIAGWKVGLVPPPLQADMGTNRLIGPIFQGGVVRSEGDAPVRLGAIEGGFAAIEAELVVACAADAPEGKT